MEIRLDEEQRAFRDYLRDYFAKMMTDELRRELAQPEFQEGGGPEFRKAMKQMGRDGLLGLSWPKEYGGQERTPVEQFIFADEIQATGFPLPFLTLNTVGPVLFQHGSEEQRRDICAKILAGELFISIGYSEPGAGTDLASLKTSARRDGDEWVINGQKMWTSLAQYADYIWLAARTDENAKKHKGLSMFLVPATAKGFARQEIRTVGGVHTNATFYDDVRVPAANLVGAENGGWKIITGQLNHERIALMPVGYMGRLLDEVVRWAAATKRPDGGRVMHDDWDSADVDFARVLTAAASSSTRVVTAQVAASGTESNVDGETERGDAVEVLQPLGLMAVPAVTSTTQAPFLRMGDQMVGLAIIDKGAPAQAVETGETRVYIRPLSRGRAARRWTPA